MCFAHGLVALPVPGSSQSTTDLVRQLFDSNTNITFVQSVFPRNRNLSHDRALLEEWFRSGRRTDKILEAVTFVRPEMDLFEDPDPLFVARPCSNDLLDVLVRQLQIVDVIDLP